MRAVEALEHAHLSETEARKAEAPPPPSPPLREGRAGPGPGLEVLLQVPVPQQLRKLGQAKGKRRAGAQELWSSLGPVPLFADGPLREPGG